MAINDDKSCKKLAWFRCYRKIFDISTGTRLIILPSFFVTRTYAFARAQALPQELSYGSMTSDTNSRIMDEEDGAHTRYKAEDKAEKLCATFATMEAHERELNSISVVMF